MTPYAQLRLIHGKGSPNADPDIIRFETQAEYAEWLAKRG